jgi:hypothetical protein
MLGHKASIPIPTPLTLKEDCNFRRINVYSTSSHMCDAWHLYSCDNQQSTLLRIQTAKSIKGVEGYKIHCNRVLPFECNHTTTSSCWIPSYDIWVVVFGWISWGHLLCTAIITIRIYTKRFTQRLQYTLPEYTMSMISKDPVVTSKVGTSQNAVSLVWRLSLSTWKCIKKNITEWFSLNVALLFGRYIIKYMYINHNA